MTSATAQQLRDCGVQLDLSGSIATITIDRAESLNALDRESLEAMTAALDLSAGPDLGAVVITGAGKAFCSGASLAGLDVEAPPGDATIVALGNLVQRIRSCPAPVIALVNGPAVGLGFSMALACDLIVAARSAYFAMVFTAIGLMPDGGATSLLAAAVGRSAALRICLLAERVTAAEGAALGFVTSVVDDADLAHAGRSLAERVSAGPREAHSRTKRAINEPAGTLADVIESERVGQLALMASADFREGVAAFREKRRPVFGSRE